MAKQIHVRIEDALADALEEYTKASGQSVQDFITTAIMQMLSSKRVTGSDAGQFAFIVCLPGSEACVWPLNRRGAVVYTPANGTSIASKPILQISENSLTGI